jgi:hypothetical protein
MRIRQLAPAAILALAATAACSTDRILSVTPTTVAPAGSAVSDPQSAAAAVAGMYDPLQDDNYYGGDFVVFGDLSGDNVQHSGTFVSYRETEQNNILADNVTIASIWREIYRGVNAANNVLAKIPGATYLAAATRNQYVGEAYFMRALGHHNAQKFWGAVPLVLKPVDTPAEAGEVTRSDTGAVYRQILLDLDSAEKYLTNQKQTRQGSVGGTRALRARVRFYRGDWAGALAAAQTVDALGYSLAPNYATLFTAGGSDTPEDIFRLRFNDTEVNYLSYYYYAKANGGRYEVAPTADLQAAYAAGDTRATWNFLTAANRSVYAAKFRSVSGTEHLHVIRYAEVLLIQAEALARLNRVSDALVPLNQVRTRAGIAALTLADVPTPQSAISAIIAERRRELAFEGDRWADMVRTDLISGGNGLATAFLRAKNAAVTQVLYPVPQRDRDVAAGLTQNPGY